MGNIYHANAAYVSFAIRSTLYTGMLSATLNKVNCLTKCAYTIICYDLSGDCKEAASVIFVMIGLSDNFTRPILYVRYHCVKTCVLDVYTSFRGSASALYLIIRWKIKFAV